MATAEVLAIRSPAKIAWMRLRSNRVAFFSGFLALFFVLTAFAAQRHQVACHFPE